MMSGHFKGSFACTALCLAIGAWVGWTTTHAPAGTPGVLRIVFVPGVPGVSLSFDDAVVHNRAGEGDGDDEASKVELVGVPADIQKIAVSVTIHDGAARRQTFGRVANAFIRVVNDVTGREMTRYDPSEGASTETAMIFGEVYRHNSEWKFRAVGQGFKRGLAPMARNFGVNVG